jgi:hypothetical protein
MQYVDINKFSITNSYGPIIISSSSMITLELAKDGVAIIDKVYFENNIMTVGKGIDVYTNLKSLTISNSVFTNCVYEGSTTLIDTRTISALKVSNLTFSNIKYSTEDQTNSVLLSVNKINLEYLEDSYIQDVNVSDTQLSVLKFNGFTGTSSQLRYMNISNIFIQNCTYSVFDNID